MDGKQDYGLLLAIELKHFLALEESLQMIINMNGTYSYGCAREYHVARLQCVEATEVCYNLIHGIEHVGGASLLHQLTVDVKAEADAIVDVRQFLFRHPVTYACRSVKSFADIPRQTLLPASLLHITGREIYAYGHSIIITMCETFGYAFPQPAYANNEFCFIVDTPHEVRDEKGFVIFEK